MRPKTTFGPLCALIALLVAAGCATGSLGGSATSLPVSSATSLPSSSAIELTSTALADAGEMVIQIHGPTLAPLGEPTTLTITSADAVRLEWAAPGFDGGVVDPFREAAQISVEPDDGQVGQSVTLVVTGYDFNGHAAQVSHVFEVTPARTATPPPATPLPTGLRALPVQVPPEGERVLMEALLEGKLRLVNGCLRVGEEYAGQEGELIIWPPGFWAAAVDGVIVVYDAAGQAVAGVGDWVSLSGGSVPRLFQSPTAIDSVVEQPPAECPGPYWVVGEITSEPAVAALPTATPLPQASVTPRPRPTAAPLPAGWTWYENPTAGFRIAHPESWTPFVNWQLSESRPSSAIFYRATFQSAETGASVVLDIWNLGGRRDEDLVQWVNTQPDAAIFDVADEPLTYNATVLGRPAVFHYHPARWGTNDFVVTLFVAGPHRYRFHFNSSTAPVTEGEPQIYRTMLESLQIFGQPDGKTEIPTGWEVGAGLVIDTRPIETAAGKAVDLAAAPLTPLGGLAGVVESWQEDVFPAPFTLLTDAGETYLIRVEPFRVHFRGQPIDTWFNSNTVQPPQPGERVTVTGRVIAPNEVVAGNITIQRDGLMPTWFSETLVEMAPYWEEESGFPTNAVITAADVPHLWLRGPLQTMVGLLSDDAEPPVLPAKWQPYADRTALVYGTINRENQHMEIKEVYVQDGPCEVTPATTHCQSWLQLLPEAVPDN